MKNMLLRITNVKRMSIASPLVFVAILSIFITACCKDDNPPAECINGISQEIKELIYYQGDENACAVLINVQGGPDISLSTSEVDLLIDNFALTDLLAVNVHQAQTLNPSIVEGSDITLDQAVQYNLESVEILDRVISYFKAQGRTVYIVGVSFGAFIAQELIASKGIDVADEYLIMIGRLDMTDIMWQSLAEGRFGYFENGVTPIIDEDPAMDVVERNIGKIAAGLGMNNYTERLSPIVSLSNLTYIYGATDQLVGRLTAEEVQFLESKNAKIIESSGGHDDTFANFFGQGLNVAFGIE